MLCFIFGAFRTVRTIAQFGSALDWGSRGRGFKSRWSDQESPSSRRFHSIETAGFSLCLGSELRHTAPQNGIYRSRKPDVRTVLSACKYVACDIFHVSCRLMRLTHGFREVIRFAAERHAATVRRRRRIRPMCSIQRFPKMNGRFDCPASLAWKPANALGMMASRLPN